jgi:hypothetical protein
MKQVAFIICLVLTTFSAAPSESEIKNEPYVRHRLAVGLGHTHVPSNELVDGRNKLAFASWTLDYDFHFNEKWGIGLETDFISESFTIIRPDGEELEREFPFSVTPVALYKPSERWTLAAGVGAEFAPGETLVFTRVGVEYGIEISDRWEIGAHLLWDARWDYYNAWSLALVISRLWR